MKFTLSWLKRHLDTDATLEQISETLTAIGLEVEEIEDQAKDFAAFKVAHVISAEPHPDADKLRVCSVQTADHGVQQIVCGAPNAKTGMKAVFAPDGAYIPGLDVTLKKTKIRGVESNGMLVSEKEMCLSDEHDGIIELEDHYEVGTPMAEIFGLDDPVIEIALTPNRADCAGIRGIARDLAAAGLGQLKPLDIKPVQTKREFPGTITLDDDGCPYFVGRYIKGVQNSASPEWLQRQLKAIGLRPISALVDITNFITMDHARPLHAYDADKLKGDLRVGTSKGGERLDALNDKSYELVAGAVTINDDSTENGGVIGLGGIVGGTSTGVDESTTNIVLECAYFKPERIARTGRDQGVSSDARYRFERGVDPEFVRDGMEIFTAMVLEICGGEASEIFEAGAAPEWKREIEYDPAYCQQLIGMDVPQAKQVEILESLGFVLNGSKITPPSWRGDVFGKADITEEVARIVGFGDIPALSVEGSVVPAPAETVLGSAMRKARAALTSRGLHECVTWSFVGKEHAQAFGANDNAITALTLQNPISSEMDVMRPSILPNLIEAAERNDARGYANAALCEVGPVFAGVKPGDQTMVAAGIRSGSNSQRHWSDNNAARAVDVYDAKADAIAALEVCGAPGANAQISTDAPEYYHPGRSGVLRLGKNVLASFGEIHPAILEEMGIKFPVVGFEIMLDNIPQQKGGKKKGTEKAMLNLQPLQPLSRDFAFIVDEDVKASDLVRSAMAADKSLIKDGNVFDIYQGKGVDDGKKSIALSLTIQPKGESLTDKDLEELMAKVIDLVMQKTGGVLRG